MSEGGGADERLIVMLEARISEFEKRMAKAERTGTKTYQGLQRGSARATRQMEQDAITAAARINQAFASVNSQIGMFAKAFVGGLVIGALNGVASAARNAVKQMADLADLADRIGMDVESLQGLEQGLKLTGVDDASGALMAFTDRLGDAATGQGALADMMAKAGVRITDQTGAMRDTLDIMRDYADAVKNAPDAAARMAMVTEAFGRGGKAMVLAMAEGSAGIDGMIADARAAGTVIDEDMIRKAAELDDKFDKVGQRISSIFKQGVISAAEFFGMFDRLDDLIPQNAAESMLGADLANALASNSTALEKSKADIADLTALYDQLQQQVAVAADAISNELPYLLELGETDLALELSAITGEMDMLVGAVKAGKLPAAQLDAEMQKLITRAAAALAKADAIDGVDLSGAVSAVERVSDALARATDWAGQLLFGMQKVAGVGIGSTDATGTGGAGVGANGSGVINLGPKPGGGSGGGRAGGGGRSGGGGNGKLAALLADLQSEREAMGAWYAESQALLASATDAQLAAVGGRHQALERLEVEHQERMRGIQDQSQGGNLANAETFFGAMATLTTAGGQKMVKAQRSFAALEAGINVLRAQGQVLADPKIGFFGKFAAVAAIGAAGMGIVSALGGGGKAAKGGGGASGGAGGGGALPQSQEQSPLLVTLQGLDPAKLYAGSQIIALVDAVQKEFGKRGLKLGFSG